MDHDNRIYYFDNVKALLIILVVIGHFIEFSVNSSQMYKCLFVFIYSFHMPLFIFISGLFHKDEHIPGKVLTDIIIGVVLKILIFLTNLILYGSALFSLFSDSGIPWFMFTLAAYEVLAYILRNIDKKFLLIVSVIIGCFAGYDASIGDFLYLSRTIVFFPFFVLGLMVNKETLLKITSKKNLKIISLLMLIGWFACFYCFDSLYKLRYLFTGGYPFDSFSSELIQLYGGFFRMLCYIVSIAIGFSVLCVVPQKKLDFFSSFGTKSIQVYFWHQIILAVLKKTSLSSNLVNSPTGRIIWIVCAVAVAFFTGIKIFSFPVKQIKDNCRVKA